MQRLFALLIVALVATPAVATDDICWERDMERLDTFGNPPSRGDNNFFTFTVSGTANVTMLYPGTQSMRRLPISLYELWTGTGLNGDAGMSTSSSTVAAGSGKGCSSTTLNNLPYFMPSTAAAPAPATGSAYLGQYKLATRYPEPETTYSGGGGLADGFESSSYSCSTCTLSATPGTSCPTSSCSVDKTGGHAWEYGLWPANDSGTMHTGADATTTCTGFADTCGTVNTECAAANGGSTSSLDYQDCTMCVRAKGYWINYNKLATNSAYTGADAMVVKGNWLNFSPPKWAMLRLAYKRLVNGPLLNPLREGIVTNCSNALGCSGGNAAYGTSAAAGEYRLQKMLPQSCNGAGRPNQRISSVDPVKYNSTTNPIAEMLFNAAWTVSADSNSGPPSTWSFFTAQANSSPSLGTHPGSEPGLSGQTNSKDGFCPGCNSGFSVLFTDGRGIDGLRSCDSSTYPATAVYSLATAPGYCRDQSGALYDSKNACTGTSVTAAPGLGAEDDGNDYLNPNLTGGAKQALDFNTHWSSPPTGVCPNDFLDLVAQWMYGTNMLPSQAGTNLRLYVIEIGSNFNGKFNSSNAAAAVGHGRAVSAQDFNTLEQNIQTVFQEINSTATSFSVAAITTVQTRGTTFAFIPRFRPLLGSQWEGRLYRFRLFNEFAAGCSTADLTGGPDGGPIKDAVNPNGNSSCNDIYLTDANNNFVGEDDGGTFVLLDNSQPYSATTGWPIKSPRTAAAPVWEAANIIECREDAYLRGVSASCDDGGTAIAARQILTLPLDGGTVPLDGGLPPPGTALIQFNNLVNDAGVAQMTNYMKLAGVNSDFCQSMSLATRQTYTVKEDCGRDTMRFMEGQDVLAQNPDGGRVRPNVMGDVFHSSPILVTPPAPTFLCETGILTQCVRTLYAEDTACSSNGGSCTPNSMAAYAGDGGYFQTYSQRDELILVGSNDGMLHAFQAGTYRGDAGYDEGTGVEKWAFIPPDMLPKLQRYVLGGAHEILVDGSPWVRDIWRDGSGSSAADRQKQADEFHTIAIIGERGGGRHYTALDVTDTANPPKYLWSWPTYGVDRDGNNYDLAAGESWNDTTPNPPPIGPVLIADAQGPISMNATIGGTNVTGRASERWVVAINGGYDPNLIRGRAVYILDAWDGSLLYKFSRYDHSGVCSGFPECSLGPVAAPISMLDSNFDNFFDLAVFGDTTGNIFTIDMLNPGGFSGGLVNNWYGGLTFTEFKGGNLARRSPFFSMASARIFDDSKGGPRVYLGSGDRDQIRVRDTDMADGGTCQADNLRGCMRNNCSVDVNQKIYEVDGGTVRNSFLGEWQYASGATAEAKNTFTLSPGTTAGSACTDSARMEVDYTVTCGSTSLIDPNTGTSPATNTVYCDWDGGLPLSDGGTQQDAGEECPDVTGKPLGVGVSGTVYASLDAGYSTFYSVKLFDAPTYSTHPRMTTTASQSTYNTDSNVLTDSKLANADSPDGGVGGWYVTQKNDLNEKTASGALLLGGCVAWNTLVPQNTASDGGSTCGNGFIPASTAYLYQANDDTGGIQCGLAGSSTQLATVRYQARTVTETVPQQPTPVVSLNAKTGQAGYSGVSLEPGGKIPLQVSVGAASVQGDVSWIDVSRTLHNCRHPADGGVPVCN